MRFAAQSLFGRFAAAIMMAAVTAFTLQATFIAPSEGATEETSLYHHGFARSHSHQANAHHHEVAHVHADGTAHRHAIDDDDGALDDHIQEPGCPCCWNMAIVVGVLPTPTACKVALASGARLAIEAPVPYRDTEPNGPRRPPRPPSIA